MNYNKAAITELGKMCFSEIMTILEETQKIPAKNLPSDSQLSYFKQYILTRSVNDIRNFLEKKSNQKSSRWHNKDKKKCLAAIIKDKILDQFIALERITPTTTLLGRELFGFFDKAQIQPIEMDNTIRKDLFSAVAANFMDRLILQTSKPHLTASSKGCE